MPVLEFQSCRWILKVFWCLNFTINLKITQIFSLSALILRVIPSQTWIPIPEAIGPAHKGKCNWQMCLTTNSKNVERNDNRKKLLHSKIRLVPVNIILNVLFGVPLKLPLQVLLKVKMFKDFSSSLSKDLSQGYRFFSGFCSLGVLLWFLSRFFLKCIPIYCGVTLI